jgi:hypothetical protein
VTVTVTVTLSWMPWLTAGPAAACRARIIRMLTRDEIIRMLTHDWNWFFIFLHDTLLK